MTSKEKTKKIKTEIDFLHSFVHHHHQYSVVDRIDQKWKRTNEKNNHRLKTSKKMLDQQKTITIRTTF